MSNAGKALAGLFGLAGLPLSVVLVQQGFATWWVAALLLVLYEGVIALGAIVVSVAQQALRRRVEQVVDFFDLALGRGVSRYSRYYRRYVLERDSHINARDLAHTPSHIPELDAVYVDVGLAPGSPRNQTGGLLPAKRTDQSQRLSIHEFLDKEAPTVCAVIGAPGSGKSTLLRHTARRAVSQRRKERRRRIPVMLALRDHAEVLASDPTVTLADRFREDVGRLSVSEPAGWWETQLRKGNCLVLLDGLDEVARNEDRAAVAEWIEEQIAKHPNNDFVITSRPHGYQTAVISRAMVLQVRPFTTDQIRKFIHAWCRAAEHLATRASGTEIEQRARVEAEDLIGQLSTAPALIELAVNPLLLTMMVMVHRERRSLPAGRSDLYNQVCDVMLWRRQESKKLEVKPPGTVRQRILAALAYDMMVATTRDYPRAQVLEVFERSLQQIDTDITGEDLLMALVESSGLLVEREKDLYAFTHHTIGEYLAATHIRSNNLVATLIHGVDDPWWRETTLLFANDSDASDIIEACLDKNTRASFSLAFDCLRTNGQLSPQLRARLDQLRAKAFEDEADDVHRRRVASALAAGHLSKLVTADNGTLICPDPILEDLYWLFCKLTGIEFPTSMGRVRLAPATPATGMWPRDVEAFVQWLNETAVRDIPATYRLPSNEEVASISNNRSAHKQEDNRKLAIWTLPDNYEDDPVLWTSDGSNPFSVTVDDIRSGINSDLSNSTLLLEYMLIGALLDARTLVKTFERSLDKEFARDLPMTYAQSQAAAIDLSLALTLDINLIYELGFDREQVFNLTEIQRRIHAGNNKQNLDYAEEVRDKISLALGSLRGLPIDLDLLSAKEFLPPILDFDGRRRAREEVIGVTLSRAISATNRYQQKLTQQGDDADLRTAFSAAFAEGAGIRKAYSVSINIGGLEKSLDSACSILQQAIIRQGTSLWAATAASTFAGEAMPLLTRARTVSPADFTDIRIQALMLASEAEACGILGTAEEFRRLAAGVTLLEFRAVGKAPLETIILARE